TRGALRHAAGETGTAQLELVGQDLEQRRVGRRAHRPVAAVHLNAERIGHDRPPASARSAKAERLRSGGAVRHAAPILDEASVCVHAAPRLPRRAAQTAFPIAITEAGTAAAERCRRAGVELIVEAAMVRAVEA